MMNFLTTKHDIKTFSISPENLTGEKGGGGRAVEGTASHAAQDLGQGWKVNPYLLVGPGETIVLADYRGEGAIKHIWLTDSSEAKTRQLWLRIYFDGQEYPAVSAPVADFFCNATYEYRQLSSLAMCVNPRRGLNCYFEMPFRTGFRVEIENLADARFTDKKVAVYYQIDCEEKMLPADSLYFHARYNRVNPLPYKENYVILDKVEGCGHYVGTYLHWGVKSNGWWGEGEIKFYMDGDTDFPTICGTGTEDYICGAYNFDVDKQYVEFTTPYSGMYKVGETDDRYHSQRYFDMYRWHITDPVYFKKDLRVTIQALGWRRGDRYLPLQDDISSVAYWYSDNLSDGVREIPTLDELEQI